MFPLENVQKRRTNAAVRVATATSNYVSIYAIIFMG